MGDDGGSISEITRRDITDLIAAEHIAWAGRLEEPAFLARLYDRDQLPSRDPPFRTAERDIIQHRIANGYRDSAAPRPTRPIRSVFMYRPCGDNLRRTR